MDRTRGEPVAEAGDIESTLHYVLLALIAACVVALGVLELGL